MKYRIAMAIVLALATFACGSNTVTPPNHCTDFLSADLYGKRIRG